MVKKEYKKYIVYGVLFLVLLILAIAVSNNKSIDREEDMLSEESPELVQTTPPTELVTEDSTEQLINTFIDLFPIMVIMIIAGHVISAVVRALRGIDSV